MTTAELLDATRVLRKSSFASIRELQVSPTKVLNTFRIITNNGKPKTVCVPFDDWAELQEDFEALRSKRLIERVAKARAKPSRGVPATEAWARLGLK